MCNTMVTASQAALLEHTELEILAPEPALPDPISMETTVITHAQQESALPMPASSVAQHTPLKLAMFATID